MTDPRRGAHHRAVRAAVAQTLPAPCTVCRLPVNPTDRWHLDHIVPLRLGGTTSKANCGPAHERCNLAKGARLQGQRPAAPSTPWLAGPQPSDADRLARSLADVVAGAFRPLRQDDLTLAADDT